MSQGQEELSKRIDKIDEKIDKLIQAVTELARINAVISHIEKRQDTNDKLVESHESRLDLLEKKTPLYDLVVKAVGAVSMLILVAIASGVLSLVILTGKH